jgi:hypothetical protein
MHHAEKQQRVRAGRVQSFLWNTAGIGSNKEEEQVKHTEVAQLGESLPESKEPPTRGM